MHNKKELFSSVCEEREGGDKDVGTG